MLSVDSKKKELVENFKNPGTRYKRTEDLTNDHDYLTYASGKAALYGVLDSARNRSFVSIGQFLREGNTLCRGLRHRVADDQRAAVACARRGCCQLA
ncbi:MAG: hypothetical protein IIC50_16470 [Planctomycetes bacterium]|nr:hypothetical protein [Planctomycetota bacterium]